MALLAGPKALAAKKVLFKDEIHSLDRNYMLFCLSEAFRPCMCCFELVVLRFVPVNSPQ